MQTLWKSLQVEMSWGDFHYTAVVFYHIFFNHIFLNVISFIIRFVSFE